MKRRNIKLAWGEEVQVNGYVVRATGLDSKHPESLAILHPNVYSAIDATRNPLTALYAGQADNVACASVISVGTVGRLIQSDGWPRAIETARAWLAKNLPYFTDNKHVAEARRILGSN